MGCASIRAENLPVEALISTITAPAGKKDLKGSLAHALKVTISPQDLELLLQYLQTLPEELEQEQVSMG